MRAGTLILIAVVAAGSLAACRSTPRKVPSRSSKARPDKPPEPRDLDEKGSPPPLDLVLERNLESESPCGDLCERWSHGKASVKLALLADGSARALDSGTHTLAERSLGRTMTTTRTWSFMWQGSWSADGTRRVVRLDLDSSSCDEASTARGKEPSDVMESERDCPPSISRLVLYCSAGLAGDGVHVVWSCSPGKSVAYSGTEFPWKLETGVEDGE